MLYKDYKIGMKLQYKGTIGIIVDKRQKQEWMTIAVIILGENLEIYPWKSSDYDKVSVQNFGYWDLTSGDAHSSGNFNSWKLIPSKPPTLASLLKARNEKV